MTGPATRRDVQSEVETPRASFERRLRLLGATEEEIGATLEAYDDAAEDPELTDQVRRLVTANDSDLRAAIAASRDDYEEQTLTPDEQADLDADRAAAEAWTAIVAAAYDQVHQAIPGVVGWVNDQDDPPLAARAVLQWERQAETPRVTLVDELEKISAAGETDNLGDADADADGIIDSRDLDRGDGSLTELERGGVVENPGATVVGEVGPEGTDGASD